MPITLPADDAAPYTWTQPIRDGLARCNALTNDTTGKIPANQMGVTEANIQSGTSYTPALSDLGKIIETTNNAPVGITIPKNSTVNFPVGAVLDFCQIGTGQITFTGESTGVSYSEPFTTTLALTWSTMSGGSISVSGGTQGTLSGGAAQVRADHDVGSPDMFTQLNWTGANASVDHTMGVCTRCSTSALTAYLFEIDDFTNVWTFTKLVAGVYTQLGTGSYSPTRPLAIRLESQGTTHRLYAGGVLLSTITDASITTGQRGGIVSYNPTAASILFDDFSTGALSSLTSITFRTPSSYTSRAQNSTVSLRQRAVDDWVFSGDLT